MNNSKFIQEGSVLKWVKQVEKKKTKEGFKLCGELKAVFKTAYYRALTR